MKQIAPTIVWNTKYEVMVARKEACVEVVKQYVDKDDISEEGKLALRTLLEKLNDTAIVRSEETQDIQW